MVLIGIMLVLVGCFFGIWLKFVWLFVGVIGISYLVGLISFEDMLINYVNFFLIIFILFVFVLIVVEKIMLV